MAYYGEREEVRKRLVELYKAMLEKRTLRELAEITGRTPKQVHKDIGKLGREGCVIGSRLGLYWIEV